MQISRIVQAVMLMMIVALAASCAASKDYTSKLFAPRTPVIKDSQVLALRFLELDKLEPNPENMVSTDVIMGRDTATSSVALDNLANTLPANPDSTIKTSTPKTNPVVLTEKKIVPEESVPVAKSSKPGEVRTKRTREK
jgi:hypothetical protein